jgi:hypothetical protein
MSLTPPLDSPGSEQHGVYGELGPGVIKHAGAKVYELPARHICAATQGVADEEGRAIALVIGTPSQPHKVSNSQARRYPAPLVAAHSFSVATPRPRR